MIATAAVMPIAGPEQPFSGPARHANAGGPWKGPGGSIPSAPSPAPAPASVDGTRDPGGSPDQARMGVPEGEAAREARLAETRRRILAAVVGIRVSLPEPRLSFKGRRKIVAEVSPSEGNGSGIVVDPQGLVLTCAHLVGDATKVRVFFGDDREVAGTVTVSDGASDLALVKIEAGSLTALDPTVPSPLTEGQDVFLASRPGGASARFVAGTLTAPGTYHVGHSQLEFFRHFRGDVEHGDSGGALVDLEGRLLGLLSVGQTEGRFGYAIAREFVTLALPRLRAGPPVVWPWLGLAVEAPPDPPGALVWAVAVGSPAQASGFGPGDRIVTLDDRPIEHFLPAMLTVLARPVGSRFRLGFRRTLASRDAPPGGGEGAGPGWAEHPRAGKDHGSPTSAGGRSPGDGPRPEVRTESRTVVVASAPRPVDPFLPPLDLFEKLTGVRLGWVPSSARGPAGFEVVTAPAAGEGHRSYEVGSHLVGIVPGLGLVRALEEGRNDQEIKIKTVEDLAEALRASSVGGRLTAAVVWVTQGKPETMFLSGEARRHPIL